MINFIELTNFKCFRKSQFQFGKLTVFCGSNGAGKSSIIQSLLFAQLGSRLAGSERNSVALNGLYGLELGTVADVLSHNAETDSISIKVAADDGDAEFIFDAAPGRHEDRFLTTTSKPSKRLESLDTRKTFNFQYLSADRHGPKDTQIRQSEPASSLTIGCKGEYVAEVVAAFERERIGPQRCNPKMQSENDLLLRQLELWMADWCPGILVKAGTYPDSNVAYIRIKRKVVNSDWMLPTNMGFGISYSLPIVAAGLLAADGGILIVDSPESHLHPSGQSAMGNFLAAIAASGVQVVVETHSDHILNGFRIAAMDRQNGIQPADIIFYHSLTDESNWLDFDRVSITQTGGLSNWPKGFFDQREIDLARLSKLKSM